MTVYIETPDLKTIGKISFVDLAGSEKVKDSNATGSTLTETLSINKSLLTLGNCISMIRVKERDIYHTEIASSQS